ncbi:MAG: cysteine desulfurase family protein [Endomicrobiia bacterium]
MEEKKNVKKIYFDNVATTPLDPRVKDVMMPYLDELYYNPQSSYSYGYKIKEDIENSRAQVAKLINADVKEIIFTSSGSESNNLAIKGVLSAIKGSPFEKHIITSKIEHYSVLHPIKSLERQGYKVTYLSVDKYGFVNLEELKKSITPQTVFVSIQYANSEIGTIQNIEEIVKIVKEKNIIFHTDAVAVCGQISIDVKKLNIDLLSLSGTQFYGPKGAAALYVKKGVRILPQIEGGVQEEGRRAGTENVPAIIGLGKAAELALVEMDERIKKLLPLREKLIFELPKRIPYLYINGHPTQRLPNNVHCAIEFIEGEAMMLLLDNLGILVSSGSACASKALKASYVLTEIGLDSAVAQGSLLFSLGIQNSEEDIDYVLEQLPKVVIRLREMSPLWAYFQKTGKRQEAGPGTDYEHMHENEENIAKE